MGGQGLVLSPHSKSGSVAYRKKIIYLVLEVAFLILHAHWEKNNLLIGNKTTYFFPTSLIYVLDGKLTVLLIQTRRISPEGKILFPVKRQKQPLHWHSFQNVSKTFQDDSFSFPKIPFKDRQLLIGRSLRWIIKENVALWTYFLLHWKIYLKQSLN